MRCDECSRQFRKLYHCFDCGKKLCAYCIKKVKVRSKILYVCTDCYTKLKLNFKEEDFLATGKENGGFQL
jgi:ribosome-binding protein aMBF1 (putative translation factor)